MSTIFEEQASSHCFAVGSQFATRGIIADCELHSDTKGSLYRVCWIIASSHLKLSLTLTRLTFDVMSVKDRHGRLLLLLA